MTEISAELRARIETMDASSLYVSLTEVIKQLEGFNGVAVEQEAFEHPSGCITAAIVHSEAGDEFLEVFPGVLSAQEIAAEVFLANPDWWSEPEMMSIGDIRVCSLPSARS